MSPVDVYTRRSFLKRSGATGAAVLGGRLSSSVNPCRDSFVAMALVLEALAEEGGTIAEMRARVPTYVMAKEKLDLRAREIGSALRRLQDHYRDETLDLTDGVKVVWPDRWVHARPSNTEPVVRIVAEAHEEKQARELVRAALERLSPTG